MSSMKIISHLAPKTSYCHYPYSLGEEMGFRDKITCLESHNG